MKIFGKSKFALLIISVLFYSCIKNFEPISIPQKILFSTVDDEYLPGFAHIYSINSDGTNLKQLTNSHHFDVNPILTPDNSEIIFTRINGGSDIYIMNCDGSKEKMLVQGEYYVSFPSISSDGSMIVYEYKTGNPMDPIQPLIYLTHLISGENIKLTDNVGAEPQFSPTENRILFAAGDLYTISFNDTNNINLTNNDSIHVYPRYSPDGSKIVYMSKSYYYNNFNIWIMDSNGHNKQKLTNDNDFNNYYPEFSPDGTKIVFQKPINGKGQIFIMNSNGTGIMNLTSNSNANFLPQFSQNGKKIIFHSTRDGNSEIYIMDLDGSDQRNLTKNSARDILRTVKNY